MYRFNQAVKNPDPTIEEALSISFNFKSTFFMDQIHVQLQDLYEEKIESLTESSTKANEIKKKKRLI